MLFNSYAFLFAFLPVTLLGYFLVARFGREPAIVWLVLASLFFYGWWNPVYLVLLVGSILFNFQFGRLLAASAASPERGAGRAWLALGVCVNLALLAYFKYANFAVNTIAALSGMQLCLATIGGFQDSWHRFHHAA